MKRLPAISLILTFLLLSITVTQSITNYDLRLYNEDGSILLCESSLDATSNVELFKYKTSKAGYYRLAIYQNGNLPEGIQGDFVGIAYHYTTSLF